MVTEIKYPERADRCKASDYQLALIPNTALCLDNNLFNSTCRFKKHPAPKHMVLC